MILVADGQSKLTTMGRRISRRILSGERLRTRLLSTAALFLLIASASELWVDSEPSFFSRVTRSPISWLVLLALSVLLASLYAIDYLRIHSTFRIGALFVAPICTGFDIGVMYLITFALYVLVGDLAWEDIFASGYLLYIAIPLVLGEFTLSSLLSHQLEEVKNLRDRAKKALKRAKKLTEDFKSMSREFPIPEVPDDNRWIDYRPEKTSPPELDEDDQ